MLVFSTSGGFAVTWSRHERRGRRNARSLRMKRPFLNVLIGLLSRV
jgi:hypothetical protein